VFEKEFQNIIKFYPWIQRIIWKPKLYLYYANKTIHVELVKFCWNISFIIKNLFLLCCFVLLNFLKFKEVVWPCLKLLCKSYKRNMETEKNKKKERKKGKKGETDRTAQSGPTSLAHLQPATPVPLFFPLSFLFLSHVGPPCHLPPPAINAAVTAGDAARDSAVSPLPPVTPPPL
jgi:hypothetical protein